ncbi:MAG: ATP-binding protein [Acidobacteriota bacterium]
MKDMKGKLKFIAVLAITSTLVVLGVLNLRDRLSAPPVADDGVQWVDTDRGVKAKRISPASPLYHVLREGDYLRAIFYKGKYEEIKHAETVSLYLDRQGLGNDARYTIEHPDPLLQGIYQIDRPLFDFDFKVAQREQNRERELYMALIGLVYLVIGLFVLLKRSRAAFTYHFYAWFLVSFIVYFYSSTLEFSRLDKMVSVIDHSALALLAPLFLHFCANFPSGKGLLVQRPRLAAALYLPALGLIAGEILYHYYPRVFKGGSLVEVRNLLGKGGLFQYSIFFILGSALLVRTFIRSQKPLLRQQLKWIIWGLAFSVLPFAALYIFPFVSQISISPVMEAFAYGPLILIPLSFGYSIVRYRLMDVDVIMRRSFVHVMAIIAVAAIYMAVLLGAVDLVKFIWAEADLNYWGTKVIVVAVMLLVTMVFAPIKNKLQEWADRWFYGERYTLRTQLEEFGRTLAQTTALPRLLDSLVRRLSEVLPINKIAIFIEGEESHSGFQLAYATGLEREATLPQNIRKVIRVRSMGRGYVIAEDLDASLDTAGLHQLSYYDDLSVATHAEDELYYYVPCVVRDRMVAIIGVGRSQTGALLTTDDIDLLKALSGYVAIAIDNSLLYRSEMEKADELARLKEFSENIIESVKVGILVVDFDGSITTWNSALEEIFSIRREQSLGRNVREVFDPDLIETIENATGQGGWALRSSHHIYKYHATVEDGRKLTLNISLAPFEAARGVVTGAMIVIENATERAQLEQQLMQREKLSSIGLLAAGVAHEVNTPLAGISSYAQMLLQQIPESDQKHKLLEKIHLQTLRASEIVNNLLNFSRTGDTQFREVDINRVIDDTIQLLEPQLRSARMELARNYSQELAPAYGNPSKLQQVFMNLIINARDAMPGGGRLTIQTRMVETSLVVDFRDTGTGIDPENIARIYDPFFTTKEVGRGTGLGLAISYGIIQEHGGRMFVESRPGEGAHFTIKLPTVYSRQMQAASD